MYLFMHTILLIVCKYQDYDGAVLLVSDCTHKRLTWCECSILTAPNMEFTELSEGTEALFLN